MKHKFFLIIFLFFLTNIAFAQTGTIKVAKPKEIVPPPPIKKDSITPFKKVLYITADFGTNYTFKGNNKLGFDGGILFRYSIFRNSRLKHLVVGVQYDYENIYYKLSAYNSLTKQTDIPYTNSQNQSEFIKIPIRLQSDLHIGARGTIMAFYGITPKYLLKNTNAYNRLNRSDFNQFNLAWTIGIGHKIFNQIWYKIEYSKDFFQNLKDIHVYNSNGEVIGKQKSQTNLLSLTIYYKFIK
jgi:hypothetical protein